MVTVKEMKDLLKKELTPINNTLQQLSSNFDGLKDSVKFLSDKYDDLLRELHSMNEKHDLQSKNLKKAREELNEAKQRAAEAKQQAEELAQYIRRDCVEIAGIQPTMDLSCEAIVNSIGETIGVPITADDISIAHPIPSYNQSAAPKLIVKFTRRQVRNKFYQARKKLASKKAKDLPRLGLESDARVYISESLTPYKKKLFGQVNKLKKRLKWKYIWTYNGRIYLKQDENNGVHIFDKEEDFNEFQSRNR
jgi:DNA repair exonuclease SbcCD ATPase subunit